jgi:HK97 family phage major capsid protein
VDQETLDALKGELGKFGETLGERAKASEEKAKVLEEKIAKLEDSAADFKQRYLVALMGGKPITMRADESVDDFIKRGIEETAEEQVVRGVRQGSPDTVRRGLHGVSDHRGLKAMRVLRALAVSFIRTDGRGVDLDVAAKVCDEWGDRKAAGTIEEQRDLLRDAHGSDITKRERAQRALGTGIAGLGGGFIKPDDYAGFLDYLHPKTVVRKLGATSVPMPNGILPIPYLDSAASAAYRGEHAAAATSDVGEKILTLVAKSLAGQIVMSNELLASASFAVEVFLRNHLGSVMASKFDQKALRGLGTANEIRGFDWWLDSAHNSMVASAHKFNRTLDSGSVTAKTIRANLMKMMEVVEDEDVDLGQGTPGYAMCVREKWGLMRVTDTQDRLVFGPEMLGGTLLGVPYASTTQIPKNLVGDGSGHGTGNKSRIYFADFSTVAIGEVESPQVEFQRGGSYKDASGNVQSGFSNNESALAIFERHDLGFLYRGKEGAILDSCDFGVGF